MTDVFLFCVVLLFDVAVVVVVCLVALLLLLVPVVVVPFLGSGFRDGDPTEAFVVVGGC